MARRKQHEAVHENHERWLLTYADMITLLVAFFIMLYSISNIEQKKLDRLKTGVRSSLGILPGGRSLLDASETPPRPTPAEKIYRRVERFVQQEGLQSQVSVRTDPDGAVIRLESGGMLFDTGTADLKQPTRDILEAIFRAIAPEVKDRTIRKIRVEGHTDNVPIRTGRFPSNWQLSTARATNVVQYLAERHPLLTPHLEAAGCANMRPVVPNTSPEARAKNRRIEIRVLQRTD